MSGCSTSESGSDYSPPVIAPDPSASSGSRTAAYLVAGALGTLPAVYVLAIFLGFYGAVGGVVVLWTSGIVWLLKKRQEDPSWAHRPPTGRR